VSTAEGGIGTQLDPAPKPQRAEALDALRGLAILLMCLSGVVPYRNNTLPSWMYHAQFPPPANRFDPTVAGYTWVDLVFPMFLFAMGAAFPLAMNRRLERGLKAWRLLPGLLGRGLSLAAFAVFVQNTAPYHMNSSPDTWTWIIALIAFFLLFPIYMRYPRDWPAPLCWTLRLAAIAIAFLLLESITFPNGEGWTVTRFDIIIMVLANMAFFGGAIWLFTRHSIFARLVVMAVVYAMLLARGVDGSLIKTITQVPRFEFAGNDYNLGWLYNFAWLKYLLVVLPGSIVGDLLYRWMRDRADAPPNPQQWLRWLGLSLFLLAIIIFAHIGLQARWVVATPIVVVLALAAGTWFVRDQSDATAVFLRAMFGWAAAWMVLGLAFEPTEGGIKKDPSTNSYYFVSTGLSIMVLMVLTIWMDIFRWRRPFALLVMNGQNPMIAYFGIRNLLAPVVALIGIQTWVVTRTSITPWLLFGWAVVKTLALGLFTALCTRLKIFWKT